jgi:hypothetical protein
MVFCLLSACFLAIFLASCLITNEREKVAYIFDLFKGNFIQRFMAFAMLPLMVIGICGLKDQNNLDSFLMSVLTLVSTVITPNPIVLHDDNAVLLSVCHPQTQRRHQREP